MIVLVWCHIYKRRFPLMSCVIAKLHQMLARATGQAKHQVSSGTTMRLLSGVATQQQAKAPAEDIEVLAAKRLLD